MDNIEQITTEMAEHICDNLCRYPVFFKDESLEENCAECKLSKYICDILNECESGRNEDELAIRVINHYKETSKTPHIMAGCDFAISALEKQIPKKVRGISLTHEGRAGNCPCCGKFIAELENKHFCDHERCGQAIDWRNKDE